MWDHFEPEICSDHCTARTLNPLSKPRKISKLASVWTLLGVLDLAEMMQAACILSVKLPRLTVT